MHGSRQYAKHKMFNELPGRPVQPHLRHEHHGHPAVHNVTGYDKVRGSTDHVNCITLPAEGAARQLPVQGP